MAECRTTNCTGSDYCPAALHIHGCFADRGACDAPGEHYDCLARNATADAPTDPVLSPKGNQ